MYIHRLRRQGAQEQYGYNEVISFLYEVVCSEFCMLLCNIYMYDRHYILFTLFISFFTGGSKRSGEKIESSWSKYLSNQYLKFT